MLRNALIPIITILGVFLWHPVLTKLWKPTLVGSEFEAVDGPQRFLANEKLEIAEFQMYVAAG